MKFGESIRIGWRSIKAHKLRSTLTTLGVILGIAAVITFMVLGGGFTEDIVSDIEDEQEPGLWVHTQSAPAEGGFGYVLVETPIYTESDIEALEEIDDVELVAPQGELNLLQTESGDEQFTGGIAAEVTTSDMFEDDALVEGDPFTGEGEAVVDEAVAQRFDGNLSAGDELALTFEGDERANVTVSGITDADPVGQQTQPVIYLPADPYYTTTIETPSGAQERAYPSLVIAATGFDEVDSVQESVREYLETESDAAQLKGEDDRIEAQTVEDAIEQFTEIVDQLTFFIAAVAGIALVVGSIGIANIMIVSVTERTRQIGIMKAVGATRRDVLQLFLVESIILGVFGSIFGVLTGLGIGYLGVTALGWPMVYPLDWIAIAIAVGIGVGVVSGLYPAWRAAKTDPIDALRHE